ncbi:hypothetical protein AB0G48_19060 [Streptomyces rubiginosohelvolus]|uniref:hypothetical protein n=1 Tax=Streptomyces rubiginosohelvolus TaxID=67362 RepID=UPI0034096C4F
MAEGDRPAGTRKVERIDRVGDSAASRRVTTRVKLSRLRLVEQRLDLDEVVEAETLLDSAQVMQPDVENAD